MAVLLSARQNILCWPIGILNTILAGYVYFVQQLPSEAILQIVYLVMAVYGWIVWSKKTNQNDTNNFGWTSAKFNCILIALSALSGIALGYSFFQVTHSDIAYLDAILTTFSVAANYLSARKKIDNWIYWLVINAISIGLYEYKAMHWFALLFVFYFLIALRGLFGWRSSIQNH